MKLLWIFTLAITIFFAYYTYTHTSLRYKDLESVMQQNLAVEKGVTQNRLNIQQQINDYKKVVEESYPNGFHSLEEANNIQKYSNNLKIDSLIFVETNANLISKGSFSTQNRTLLHKQGVLFTNFVADKVRDDILLSTSILGEPDTSKVVSLRGIPFFPLGNETHYFPILQQQSLYIRGTFNRLTHKGIDHFAPILHVSCNWEKIMIETAPKSQTIKIGQKYEAYMFLGGGIKQQQPKMQTSEGSVLVKGVVGEMEIPNVKAQNYNSKGKATKTLSGKITIKKADGSDTTFTLSKNYTVKQLVN
jgi:hypothetical protein